MKSDKKSKNIPNTSLWLLIIISIILGTVFTFGMRYWGSSVTKEEAVYTEAEFSSYKIQYEEHHHLTEIKMNFADREPLYIDGACCDQTVIEKLDMLNSGSVLRMYVHPNSNTLLEIKNDNATILMFDDTVKNLSSEVSAFLYLGIFMYLIAAYGVFKFISRTVYSRRMPR